MANAATAEEAKSGGYGAPGYRSYVLTALVLVYTFNFIDRALVGVLNEQIKNAFNVTDFWMGLLGGPAFAILYTFMGLPLGRLAERYNRITIISLAVAIWSLMTVLCGFAGQISPVLHLSIFAVVLAPFAWILISQRMWVSLTLLLIVCGGSLALFPFMASAGMAAFGLLLIARIGVGVGEAGCSPPAHSVISDYFPADRRASALSVYSLGIPIGTMFAAVGGGWIAQNLDWRIAFIVLGLPGVILAILVKLTVKEPARSHHGPPGAVQAEPPGFFEVLGTLARKWTFWNFAMGCMVTSFVGYGVGQFLNSYFMRTHGLGPFDASIYFGVVAGLGSALGTFLGGFLSDRLSSRFKAAPALVPGIGLMIATPLYVIGLQAPTLPLLLMCLIPASVFHYFYLGPTFATVQSIVAPQMRATAAALLLFFVNLLGYGLGPPLIGFLSDTLQAAAYAGPGLFSEACAKGVKEAACVAARASGLQLALVIGVCGYAWGGLHYLLGGLRLRQDVVS